MNDLTILGTTVQHAVNRLETFPAPAGLTEITLLCTEITSLCPVTGQPDFSIATIVYTPSERCIESKSLKLYLWQFREQGIFCESLASRICQDVVEECSPRRCIVTIQQYTRGGITIIATARHESLLSSGAKREELP